MFEGVGQNDHLACGGDIFLDHNTIGPIGQVRASEDAHSLTLCDLALPSPACGGAAHHAQLGAGQAVGLAHRIAIHCRGGERWLIAQCDDIACQDAAPGHLKGDLLMGQGLDQGQTGRARQI